MAQYFPPTFKERQFNCIHCGVYSSQNWFQLFFNSGGYAPMPVWGCFCLHCRKWSFWHDEKMIVPAESPVPPPHEDMPAEALTEYSEARAVFARSPRASAALLRLAVQKLMPLLGQSHRTIDDDIKALVAQGLPVQVQQALDYCRVVGNNAVHPGEINLQDTPEMAQRLFEMLNFIVEDRIARPNQIKALYDKLPEGARERIMKRDGAIASPAPRE